MIQPPLKNKAKKNNIRNLYSSLQSL
uniref:Uncharacterized protein n=1 Tax=Anguilla anguilla TaxID=7936 RepID=A0A0E9SIX4_ANGAN